MASKKIKVENNEFSEMIKPIVMTQTSSLAGKYEDEEDNKSLSGLQTMTQTSWLAGKYEDEEDNKSLSGLQTTTQTSSLAGKYEDEEDNESLSGLQNMVKLETEEAKRAEELAEDRKLVGSIVQKMLAGGRYKLGEVEDFDEQKRTFKIGYEDGRMEEVDKDGLFEIVAPFNVVSEYVKRIKARAAEKDAKGKNKVGVAMINASNSSKGIWKNKPKPRKSKRNSDSTEYVPLATSEKKKDAYHYY